MIPRVHVAQTETKRPHMIKRTIEIDLDGYRRSREDQNRSFPPPCHIPTNPLQWAGPVTAIHWINRSLSNRAAGGAEGRGPAAKSARETAICYLRLAVIRPMLATILQGIHHSIISPRSPPLLRTAKSASRRKQSDRDYFPMKSSAGIIHSVGVRVKRKGSRVLVLVLLQCCCCENSGLMRVSGI